MKYNKIISPSLYTMCIRITYLDRRVVGSFITMTSVMSPYLVKYSLRLSETIKQFNYFLHNKKLSYNIFSTTVMRLKMLLKYFHVIFLLCKILYHSNSEKRWATLFLLQCIFAIFFYKNVLLRKYMSDKMWHCDENSNYPFAQASVN